jgi:hypothetical protein
MSDNTTVGCIFVENVRAARRDLVRFLLFGLTRHRRKSISVHATAPGAALTPDTHKLLRALAPLVLGILTLKLLFEFWIGFAPENRQVLGYLHRSITWREH